MYKSLGAFFFCVSLLITSCAKKEEQQPNVLKAVVFDFGGVIANTDKAPITQFIKTTFHLSDEEFQNLSVKRNVFLSKSGNERKFWEQYAASKGQKLNKQWFQELEQIQMKSIHPIPQMLAIVKALKKKGYRVAMLSNVLKAQAEVVRKLGLYDAFSPLLLSYKIGHEKPSPRAFKLLLKKLHVPASCVLLVDNNRANVDAAKKLGIDAILFSTPEDLVNDLASRGVELPALSGKGKASKNAQLAPAAD